MAKQTKADTKRTKTEVLPKSKRELTVKEKQNVKGGVSDIIITKTYDSNSQKLLKETLPER